MGVDFRQWQINLLRKKPNLDFGEKMRLARLLLDMGLSEVRAALAARDYLIDIGTLSDMERGMTAVNAELRTLLIEILQMPEGD